jgi:hypothetical protein
LDTYTLAQDLNALVLMLTLCHSHDAHGTMQRDAVMQHHQLLAN